MLNEMCGFRNVSDTHAMSMLSLWSRCWNSAFLDMTLEAFQLSIFRDLGCLGIKDFANSFEEDEDFIHGRFSGFQFLRGSFDCVQDVGQIEGLEESEYFF